jgi:hypothetical protein
VRNDIKFTFESKGRSLSETDINEIFIELKQNCRDIQLINKSNFDTFLRSDAMRSYHPLKAFFRNNEPVKSYEAIPAVADCIEIQVNPHLESYFDGATARMTKILLTDWLVEMVHGVLHAHINNCMLVIKQIANDVTENFFRNLLPKELSAYFSETSFPQQNVRGLCESVLHMYNLRNLTEKNCEHFFEFVSQDSYDYVSATELRMNMFRTATLCASIDDLDKLKGDRRFDVIPFAITDIDMQKFLSVDKKVMLLEALHLFEYDMSEADHKWHKFLTILNV